MPTFCGVGRPQHPRRSRHCGGRPARRRPPDRRRSAGGPGCSAPCPGRRRCRRSRGWPPTAPRRSRHCGGRQASASSTRPAALSRLPRLFMPAGPADHQCDTLLVLVVRLQRLGDGDGAAVDGLGVVHPAGGTPAGCPGCSMPRPGRRRGRPGSGLSRPQRLADLNRFGGRQASASSTRPAALSRLPRLFMTRPKVSPMDTLLGLLLRQRLGDGDAPAVDGLGVVHPGRRHSAGCPG